VAETPLDATGPAAPPRQNGELVFAAPWESRLFGLTMALLQAGAFDWEEFRTQLIAAIDEWERQPDHGVWRYYERWQVALERVLAAKNLFSPSELTRRTAALAARPAGHDHR
jgi:nitrile hydratase accessory protein